MAALNDKTIHELELIAVKIRMHIIDMLYRSKSGHPGGSLSAVDALVALYYEYMNHNPKNPLDPDRDRFILSKGHAAPALYAILAEQGYFSIQELQKIRTINCMLQGHPVCLHTPGVEASTGSLGHGLSIANGVALAGRLDKKDYQVYVMMGDGETNEGQIWEAALFAAQHKIDNLIATVDYNGKQIDGPVDEILSLGNLKAKWESFGWEVLEMNGNDMEDIIKTVNHAKSFTGKGKPIIILMKTEMGNGVDFMMGTHKWHGVAPNDEQLKLALNQLEETLGDY